MNHHWARGYSNPSPLFSLAPKNSESLHFLAEVLVLVPVQAIVPQHPHKLVGLLHRRVIVDPSEREAFKLEFIIKQTKFLLFTLLLWLISEFVEHYLGMVIQFGFALSKYLIAEPFHVRGVVTCAFHSSRVCVNLGHGSLGSSPTRHRD